MQATDRQSPENQQTWPLASLCPAPSNMADAVQRLSAFADRLASEFSTSPEAVTRKRLHVLSDACGWTLANTKWSKEDASRPRIVDQASIMLGLKVVSVEDERSSSSFAGLF